MSTFGNSTDGLHNRIAMTDKHTHIWRDTGFANLEDCAVEGCDALRQTPGTEEHCPNCGHDHVYEKSVFKLRWGEEE